MSTDAAVMALRVALVIVTLGLGLSLTLADFLRVARSPRAVAVALTLQVVLVPLLAAGVVALLGVPATPAIGLLLLAAAPGGATSSLFSHLYGGDVALTVSLTALTTVLATVTVPLVVDLSSRRLAADDVGGDVVLGTGEVAQVLALVLVPMAIGLVVRDRAPAFADRMQRPVRTLATVTLIGVIIGSLIAGWDTVAEHLPDVGGAALVLCVASLALGYGVPRALGVPAAQSLATAFEISLHNVTLAMTVAGGVLGDVDLAVPSAVYGLVMYPCAAALGRGVTGFSRRRRSPRPPPGSASRTARPPR